MSRFLLVGDVDQIQGYVFATPRLRAIRGASALVDRLLHNLPRDKYDPKTLQILRQQGGQVVALLENVIRADASDLCDCWEKYLRDESGGTATITMAYKEWPQNLEFKDALCDAFATIRQKKDSHQTPDIDDNWHAEPIEAILSSPYQRRCEYCQTYPASLNPGNTRLFWQPLENPEEKRYICLPCWYRVEAVTYIAFDDNVLKKVKREGIQIPEPYRLPYEIDELWPNGAEGHYLAYIAADGNGFGTLQENISDKDLYKAFATELEKLSFEAIAKAAEISGLTDSQRWIKKQTRQNQWTILPFMPIILAGDDLAVLLQAEDALQFVKRSVK